MPETVTYTLTTFHDDGTETTEDMIAYVAPPVTSIEELDAFFASLPVDDSDEKEVA